MNTQEEYKAFSECYYFDYNIFNSITSFWNNLNNESYQTSFFSYIILDSFYDMKKICIPYSMAHIWDILKGEKFVNNKINTINNISKGWYVSEDAIDNDLIRIDKCNDVNNHFNETYDTMKLTNEIQNAFDPLIEIAFKNAMLNDHFSDSFPHDLYCKIIDLYNEKKVKSIYDVFQFNYKIINILNVKNNINLNNISRNILISKIETYMKGNNFLNLINVKNISDFEVFFTKNLYNFKQSEFSKKIFMCSFLCDSVGLTKEEKKKVNRETFASGMINDLIHLSLGLRCSTFVTNDKNLLIKAVICKVLYDLRVKIFCIEDFYQYVVNEYIKFNFPEKDDKEITINLNISNNIFQKTIKTNFEKILYH
jgi:hypothetical protein